MTNLTCAPAVSVHSPRYPSRLDVNARPELLLRYAPAAWRRHKEIAGLLGAALAMSGPGCGQRDGAGADGAGGLADRPSLVASLFEHGDGRGRSRWALACVAVASPVYLPEDEAIALIRDELARHNISLGQQNVAIPSVIITGHKIIYGYDWVNDRRDWHLEDVSAPLEVDLLDPERQLMIEYVSQEDYDTLGGNDLENYSMDIKGVAASVGSEVRRQSAGVVFGAFYDPVTYFSWGGGSGNDKNWPSEEEARRAAKADLRLQVHDFVNWLKAQGVI